MKKYIGVDLGGTLIRAAIVNEDGQIEQLISRSSEADQDAKTIMDNIVGAIQELTIDEHVLGIGMGVPGPVDTEAGAMVMATNIPALTQFNMVKYIEDAFNLPTFMDNDANVAGLAEAVVGVGKGLPIVYYITHSTGIGGALIVNGQVVSGAHGHAGEIANIVIDRQRKRHNELNIGAVENEASGLAIARRGQQILGDHIKDARDVFEAVAKEDQQAIALIDAIAYDFAQLLASVAHVVDPHMFVIGGGITKSKDLYFDKVIKYFKELVHEHMKATVFAFASLEEPGIVGAAMLPKSRGL